VLSLPNGNLVFQSPKTTHRISRHFSHQLVCVRRLKDHMLEIFFLPQADPCSPGQRFGSMTTVVRLSVKIQPLTALLTCEWLNRTNARDNTESISRHLDLKQDLVVGQQLQHVRSYHLITVNSDYQMPKVACSPVSTKDRQSGYLLRGT
jgi:hypothetical protein